MRRTLINALNRVPRLKRLVRRSYHFLHGEPQVSDSYVTSELLRRYIGNASPTILDIGCNDAPELRGLLQAFENPRIFCFEPDPRAAQRFKTRYAGHQNLVLFEMALSDHDGEIAFYQSGGQPRTPEDADSMPQGWDQSGSIRRPKEHLAAVPWITFEHTIKVASCRLDTWCNRQRIEAIDLIWMDVQGAELDVFRGGRETLSKTRFIYTEYSDSELYQGQVPLRQLLRELPDFKVLVRYPTDVLLCNQQLASSAGSAAGS